MLALRAAEEIDGTLMFCDLRESSVLADAFEPRLLMCVLHRFLFEIEEAITARGGTVITCLGDGVLAMFESRGAAENHAALAVAAAREIATTRLHAFNEWLAEAGMERPFAVGIGIASGGVLRADVSASERVTVTAVGKVTHTASRLEELAKSCGRSVLMAGSTRELAGRGELDFVGRRVLRGQREPTDIWALALPEPGAA